MANKLFVGGLSWVTTDDSLRTFFSQAGTVASASVISDKFTGRSRGFGFVEMSTDEEAEKAKTELNGKELDGRAIAVNDARPQEQRSGGGNFGGGGQGGGYNDRRGGGGGGRGRRDSNRGGKRH